MTFLLVDFHENLDGLKYNILDAGIIILLFEIMLFSSRKS
jgi:hypothetical protein